MRVVAALLLFACDDEPPPGDPGDAAAAIDMGTPDTGDPGTPDSGVHPDGNTIFPDANINDLCDPVTGAGCTPPDKCVIEGDPPGTECTPSSPNDSAFGEPCTGEDCEAGLVCVRRAATSTDSTCRKACNLGTGDGCQSLPGDYECRTTINGTNWGACTLLPPVCDPYTQAPCDPNQACQPFQRLDMTFEFRCRTAGPVAEGGACGPGMNCQRTLACVRDTNGNTSCRKICQLDGDCTPPATCIGSVPMPPFMFCGQ
jgi:hypothetical protein